MGLTKAWIIATTLHCEPDAPHNSWCLTHQGTYVDITYNEPLSSRKFQHKWHNSFFYYSLQTSIMECLSLIFCFTICLSWLNNRDWNLMYMYKSINLKKNILLLFIILTWLSGWYKSRHSNGGDWFGWHTYSLE